MRTGSIVALVAAAAVVIGVGAYMIDFDVTKEGSLPDVDVSVDGGELPEVDAEVGSVEVGTKTEEVTVPDVDVEVNTKEAEVTLPDIDVTPPDEKNDG